MLGSFTVREVYNFISFYRYLFVLGSLTVREVYNFISFYRYLFVLGLFTVGEVNIRYRDVSVYRYLSISFFQVFPDFFSRFSRVFPGFPEPIFPEPIFFQVFQGQCEPWFTGSHRAIEGN